MSSELIVESHGGSVVLTLNRPHRLNALSAGLRRDLANALERACADPGVAAIVLTGAGERAFCAGQDLHESAALEADDGGEWMNGWTAYFDALARCGKPFIAAVNGVAAGAGFQTALLADIRVATPDSRFLMAEANAGLPAIVGGHLLAAHLGRSRATELVLTARTVAADEALAMGLVTRLAPRADLLTDALAIADELARKPPVALGLTVGRFRELIAAELREAETAACRYQGEAIRSGQPQVAMKAFFAQRGGRRDHPTQSHGE